MSTYYSFSVAVGFEIGFKHVLKKYGRELPEKSRMEDRFDPKSGKKVDPVKVVDRPAGLRVVIRKRTYDPAEDAREICEALGREIGAKVQLISDNPECGLDGDDWVLVSPAGLRFKAPGGIDYGRSSADGGFPVKDLAMALPKFERLKAQLHKLGLRPGDAVVRTTGGFG